MKPLKFRVWDNKDKLYITQDNSPLSITTLIKHNIALTHDGIILISYNSYDGVPYEYIGDAEINGYLIEYSTGLFDEKGKEIYVGDILISEEDSRHNPGLVVFKDFSFKIKRCGLLGFCRGFCQEFCLGFKFREPFDQLDAYYALDDTIDLNFRFTIIGNIHQNPELLNEAT